MLSINKHQCKKSCNCITANRMQKGDTSHLVVMWWISPCQELQIPYTSYFHGKLTYCGIISSKCLIISNARIRKRTQMWIKELGTNNMRMEKKINWAISTKYSNTELFGYLKEGDPSKLCRMNMPEKLTVTNLHLKEMLHDAYRITFQRLNDVNH